MLINSAATYWAYEMYAASINPSRAMADATRVLFLNPLNPWSHTEVGKSIFAAMELFERTTRRYGRPEWGIDSTVVNGAAIPIEIRSVWERPFGQLLHFCRTAHEGPSSAILPRLLVLSPMAGHFGTVLRETVCEFLPNYDVFVTEWADARMVPLTEGNFDLDDYIDYVISILEHLKGDIHVIAVCQSAVPLLAAVSLMEAEGNPNVPKSMTLISGTVDTRINPTVVNHEIQRRGLQWFSENTITKVPFPHPGEMRDVYPGFFQLNGFINLDLDREIDAHKEFFKSLVRGDVDFAEKFRSFYDEYLAVMDLSGDFFLQTVDAVFLRHTLALGEMTHRGVLVNPANVRRTALMTVEAEFDTIASVGQTKAAHDLCVNIPHDRRAHYVQEDVGHYGVFNGVRFSSDVLPRIDQFIRDQEKVRRPRSLLSNDERRLLSEVRLVSSP